MMMTSMAGAPSMTARWRAPSDIRRNDKHEDVAASFGALCPTARAHQDSDNCIPRMA